MPWPKLPPVFPPDTRQQRYLVTDGECQPDPSPHASPVQTCRSGACFALVAGAGFEPAKEYSDGFTVRSHWPLGQPAMLPRLVPGAATRKNTTAPLAD